MDDKMTGALREAIGEILEGFLGERPRIGAGTSVWLERFRCDMTGVVGLAGERAGLVAVYATRGGVRGLAARILGKDDPAPDEMRDTLCEIANMIAGNLGRFASGLLPPLATSIPSVIEGENFYLRFVGGIERTILPVEVGGVEVIVDFVISSAGAPAGALGAAAGLAFASRA